MESNRISAKRKLVELKIACSYIFLYIRSSQNPALFADKENLNAFFVCFALSCDIIEFASFVEHSDQNCRCQNMDVFQKIICIAFLATK